MGRQLPVIPRVKGLHCEDHATYVARVEDGAAFIQNWAQRGLYPMPAIVTEKHPGRHIALVRDPRHKKSCEQMVGLTVSDDPNSAINNSIRLYGGFHIQDGILVPGKLQHRAFEVAPDRTIDEICDELEERGVKFMTPILRYKDSNGARLEQRFVACNKPYGPFVEIIKRGVGTNGESFNGFNASQIDALYEGYTEYSERLLKER